MRLLAIVLSLAAVMSLVGCGPETPPAENEEILHPMAEAYVRLALEVGRHRPDFIDAYYGPPGWREAAQTGEPTPVAELLDRARSLLSELRNAPDSDRRLYLEKQVIATEAFLRKLAGEPMTLAEEARLLYDIEVPEISIEDLEAARARLEQLLPGDGQLADRVQAFRAGFRVPPDRRSAVVDAALSEFRRRTAAMVQLPDGETFVTSYVSDKPWGAYNWYLGGFKSRIEFNTDLPAEIGGLTHTVAHESYPGHHAYNSLLERHLVRDRGWVEYSIYVLYSPQSLIAEGTANAGIDVVMNAETRTEFLRETLAPLAGLPTDGLEKYLEVLAALEPLRYSGGLAARLLLDDGAPEDEVVNLLVRYGLNSEERARKSVEFFRAYGAYVYTYTIGEDLVNAYIGTGNDRPERFFSLLTKPVVPSQLTPRSDG